MTPHGYTVRTWADGFGVWCAHVRWEGSPIGAIAARRVALDSIRAELAAREGASFAPESVDVEATAGGTGSGAWRNLWYREVQYHLTNEETTK